MTDDFWKQVNELQSRFGDDASLNLMVVNDEVENQLDETIVWWIDYYSFIFLSW